MTTKIIKILGITSNMALMYRLINTRLWNGIAIAKTKHV
jgi:hypothetical protein